MNQTLVVQAARPVTDGSAGARRSAPMLAEMTDGLLNEAEEKEADEGSGPAGPMQNLKRWMKQLQFSDQVRNK